MYPCQNYMASFFKIDRSETHNGLHCGMLCEINQKVIFKEYDETTTREVARKKLLEVIPEFCESVCRFKEVEN